jgi:nucleoid-associated protein YgaU
LSRLIGTVDLLIDGVDQAAVGIGAPAHQGLNTRRCRVIGQSGTGFGKDGLGFDVWNPNQGVCAMSLLSFVKEAGEKLIDLLTPGNANASEQLKEHISKVGLGNPNVQATVDGDKVTVTGEVASQEEKEKILLAVGNIAGVGSVDDQITVTGPVVVAAEFVEVKAGDTLSAISLRVYGNANQYQKIFDANKPMLKDVNKIYPGQKLRIPK